MLLIYFACLAGFALLVLSTVAAAKHRTAPREAAKPQAQPKQRTSTAYPREWILAAATAMQHLWLPMGRRAAYYEVTALIPNLPPCETEDSFVREIVKAAIAKRAKR